MAASLKMRFCLLAAGLTCLILSYAIAQQNTTAETSRSDASASGQSDGVTSRQADSSTSGSNGRTVGEPSQNRTNYRAAQAAAAGQNPVEHFWAGCLLAKNKSEVELSQLAVQKAENPEVKQFAQKMIQDHHKMIEQLQPLATQGGASRSTSS